MPTSASSYSYRRVWHVPFLTLLPQIRDYAIAAFRNLRGDDRDEAEQETVIQSFILFLCLMSRGSADLVLPTVLVRFAIARVREGRTLGRRTNSCDVTSG